MEPYVAKKLPHDYTMSLEMTQLLNLANEMYGEYKGFLKSMNYDYKNYLESALVNDLYYSFKIDGSKMEKDEMFYQPYMNVNNDTIQFMNIKKLLYIGMNTLSNDNFSIELLNKLQKTLFYKCKKDNKTKNSGTFRKKQTYILKPGIAGSSVSFVPPLYTTVNESMKNLIEYINSENNPFLIKVALTHFQMEKVHPYISGNGKLGRIIIPMQYSYYKQEVPILFLSESIENLKNTYFTILGGDEETSTDTYLKFFLECVINQCSINIKRIKKLNKIYSSDLEAFKKEIGGSTINKVYPIMIKRIVFTTNDVVKDCNIHINSANKVLNKLVEAGYLTKEKKKGTNRVTFKYDNMYNVFVG